MNGSTSRHRNRHVPRTPAEITEAAATADLGACLDRELMQSPSVMSATLFVRGLRRQGFSNPPEAVTRLLDGRHHLERFAME